jgi:RNA polymerase sigma-70 factor (ECF subfamily)
MEDSTILALYWDRVEDAVTFTKEKYGALCRSIARRLLTDERDVDECESDVYIRAWNSIPPERPSCLSAWLARVARNAALDRIRYNAAACRSSALTEAFEELEPWLVTAEGDPQRVLDVKELRRVLNGFLRTQSPEVRQFFLRRYWYGESVQEIAQAYGVKESKVKTSLFRTRERLRKELEREELKL